MSEIAPSGARETTRQQIRGSALLLLGRGAAMPLNLLAQVLLVRYLAKSDYGALSYALAVVAFFDGVSSLGLKSALSRYIPLYHEKRDWAHFFGVMVLTLGVGLLVSGAIVAAFHVAPHTVARFDESANASTTLLLILIFLVPLEAIDQALMNLFAVLADPRFILLRRNLLAPGLKLVVTLLAVGFTWDARFVALGYVASSVLGVGLLGWLFRRHLAREGIWAELRPRQLELPAREVLGFSVPIMLTELATNLIPFAGTVLLAHFHGNAAVANLRVVLPLAGMIRVIMRSFNVLYTGYAARLHARDDHAGVGTLYWQSAAWVAAGTFPLFTVVFLAADPITIALYGGQYADSAPVLRTLAFASFFNVALGMNAMTLRAVGRVRAVVVTTALSLAAGLLVALVCIPQWEAFGAATAMAVTVVVDTGLKHFLLLRALDAPKPRTEGRAVASRAPFYGALGTALAVLVAALMLGPPGLIVSGVLAAALSAALIVAWRRRLRVVESFPEVRRLRAWLRRRTGRQPLAEKPDLCYESRPRQPSCDEDPACVPGCENSSPERAAAPPRG